MYILTHTGKNIVPYEQLLAIIHILLYHHRKLDVIIVYKGGFVHIMAYSVHNEHLVFVFAHFDSFPSPFLTHTKTQC